MDDKRFKVGDKVTYKDMEDCTTISGVKGYYSFWCENKHNDVGEITEYVRYVENIGCWVINVVDKDNLRMLESEFLGYDKQPPNELFPIY